MNLLLKALIALVVGVVVAFIVGQICVHFKIDPFWDGSQELSLALLTL